MIITQARANALSIALQAIKLGHSDRLYVTLPLYHTVALGIGVLGAIFAGLLNDDVLYRTGRPRSPSYMY